MVRTRALRAIKRGGLFTTGGTGADYPHLSPLPEGEEIIRDFIFGHGGHGVWGMSREVAKAQRGCDARYRDRALRWGIGARGWMTWGLPPGWRRYGC